MATQCSKVRSHVVRNWTKFAKPKNGRTMRFIQRWKQETTIHILRSPEPLREAGGTVELVGGLEEFIPPIGCGDGRSLEQGRDL